MKKSIGCSIWKRRGKVCLLWNMQLFFQFQQWRKNLQSINFAILQSEIPTSSKFGSNSGQNTWNTVYSFVNIQFYLLKYSWLKTDTVKRKMGTRQCRQSIHKMNSCGRSLTSNIIDNYQEFWSLDSDFIVCFKYTILRQYAMQHNVQNVYDCQIHIRINLLLDLLVNSWT